jgi:DNA-binding NarL/FixJ family response regulator
VTTLEPARDPDASGPGAIQVLCVDDDESTVRFYQLAIDEQADMRCVGIKTSLHELAADVERLRPTVLVLDLTMPGWNTLATLAELKRRTPELTALIVSGFEDDSRVTQAFQQGADGFLVKSLHLADVVDAIRRCARGDRVVPRNYAPEP